MDTYKSYTNSILLEECVVLDDYDINTIDDTTINSDDINRYQKRADISIFRNEFIRIDTRLACSPFLQIGTSFSLSCLFPHYSFNHLSGCVSRGAIYCDSTPRQSLTPVVSLLKETVYPVVRLPLRCSPRSFPVSLRISFSPFPFQPLMSPSPLAASRAHVSIVFQFDICRTYVHIERNVNFFSFFAYKFFPPSRPLVFLNNLVFYFAAKQT